MNASDQLLLHLPPVPTENQGGTGLNITNRLPLELLEQILTLACTDGGLTGCRLSLVSKRVYEVVRVSRYYSVALASGSAEQVAHFLHAYTADRARSASHHVGASAQPRVRHLLLGSARPPPNHTEDEKSDHNQDPDKNVRQDTKDELTREFQRDVSTLISLVAPDLHTLLVLSAHRSWKEELKLPPLGLTSFPLLRELTIIGNGLRFAPSQTPPADSDAETFPPLPRLTRVHVMFTAGLASGTGSALDMTRWAKRAPRITHFRISRLPRQRSDAVQFTTIGDIDAPLILPHLKMFIVQPDGRPPPAKCGNPSIQYKRFIKHLQKLHHEATRRWALLPPLEKSATATDTAIFETLARQNWADLVEGRPGCWAVDDACFNGIQDV